MTMSKRITAQFCGGYILEDGTVVVDQYDTAQEDQETSIEQLDADTEGETHQGTIRAPK